MTLTLRCRAVALSALAATSVLLAACGGGASRATPPPASTATVWLCQPGAPADPCTANLDTTVVDGNGHRTVDVVKPSGRSRFDCFYVYPTVSTEPSDNSDLKVQKAEINAAKAQAAPFSQVCRVYAPMYRQRTVASLLKGLGADPAADEVAYQSVLAGWTAYLAHFNHGRPVVFIGHSQGAAMLIRLLVHQVDPSRVLRARMVSAILLGGNVAVPTGKEVGATFRRLPLCTAPSQVGCVIAYSTFPGEPPANSLFGRPGQGVSLQSGQTATKGVHVACVNPAAIGGGAAGLGPSFRARSEPPPPPALSTPWVTYPDLYSASCRSAGGATWLQVTDIARHGDRRPVVSEVLGPEWGYHLDDVNLAMQNLVDDVRNEERAYAGQT